jgi:hypothetical protein
VSETVGCASILSSIWKRKVSNRHTEVAEHTSKTRRTPSEVRLPGRDRLLILLLAITPRNRIPFIPLDDVPLDLVRGPDWELGEGIARRTHRRFNSPRQLLNRPEDGPTELIRSSSVHPPVKGFADVSAG